MSFALAPIQFPPGLMQNGSEYQSKGRWHSAQMVRWRNGYMTPIGGWRRVALVLGGSPLTKLTGAVRAMLTYRDNSQNRWAAIGTSQKWYAFDGGALYDVTPSGFVTGNENASIGFGYGSGFYGAGTYGTARTVSGIALEPSYWSYDNWGEYVIGCCNSDGHLYQWPPGTGAATVITNAPALCRSIVVSNERYLFALGAEQPTGTANPRNVAWCDQSNLTSWTPTLTNTAGSLLLDTPGIIQRGVRFQGAILIFTDQDLHQTSYLGPPLVYGIKKIASQCGVIGPNAIIVGSTQVAWMSANQFFVFDGYVKPLACDVADFVFSNINRSQQEKVACGFNSIFNEFWWFFPTGNSTECDSYVVWNYVDNYWTSGKLARSAWADAQVWRNPIAALPIVNSDGTTSGTLYTQEDGWNADGGNRAVWIESSPFEAGSGDQTVDIDRTYQDTSGTLNIAQVTIRTRLAPNAPERTFGPYVLDDTRGYTDIRANGRQFVFRIDELAGQGQYWRIGDFRASLQAGSGR